MGYKGPKTYPKDAKSYKKTAIEVISAIYKKLQKRTQDPEI